MNPKLADLEKLVKHLQALEADLASYEQNIVILKANIERFKTDVIPSYLLDMGIEELKLDDGTKVKVGTKVFASIAEERKPAAFTWLREHNLGSIIKTDISFDFGDSLEDKVNKEILSRFIVEQELPANTTEAVHPQTLRASLKELVESATPIPTELFALSIVKEVKLEQKKQ